MSSFVTDRDFRSSSRIGYPSYFFLRRDEDTYMDRHVVVSGIPASYREFTALQLFRDMVLYERESMLYGGRYRYMPKLLLL